MCRKNLTDKLIMFPAKFYELDSNFKNNECEIKLSIMMRV